MSLPHAWWSAARALGGPLPLLVGAFACRPDFPESPHLGDVIAKFEHPTGRVGDVTGEVLSALFGEQAEGASAAAPTTTKAGDAVGLTVGGIDMPARGFIQIDYRCDKPTAGDAGNLRGLMVVENRLANTSVAFIADACQLGSTAIDGHFDIDVSAGDWAVASLDVVLGTGAEATDFVGALRACTGQGDGCEAGDFEVSLDLHADENIVLAYRPSQGVLALRDADGTWACEPGQASPQDALCARAAASITLPDVNPQEPSP